ncbi:MAG: ABC transporter ATP-binding protein [Labilithrix sp.]|nr:ABC transporter ATP-binding protein [Labilithrix sp.]MCW5811647.1 ABC transporter ATP-binding protein [Labilithrix sp.]
MSLRIEGLTVARGGRAVVEEVTFDVPSSGIVAIVGPNGAGKTTLLEAIVGLLPSRGRVHHDGAELRSFRERAAVFSFMPDEARLPEEVRVATLLRDAGGFGVAGLRARRGSELSRGEAKRVWLALTAALRRPVAVLDEPFGAFDPLQLEDLLPAFRASVTGAIVTVHQLATAEAIADQIVILAGGRVVASGTMAELRTRAGLLDGSLDQVFRTLLGKRSDAA